MSTISTQFPNGPFGDPALYVWESGNREALLFDCGDLSRFSTRQLLRVNHVLISHCHMDHLFGFDLLLRVHMGEAKTIFIYGPPETSSHIGGKLQGYTWNLTQDQQLVFQVVDLDPARRQRTTTTFRASDRFHPEPSEVEAWDPSEVVFETRSYSVRTAMLDHRTPSLAYALVAAILVPGRRYKIAYVTDGDASEENRKALRSLIQDADLVYHETCFLKVDEKAAKQTKHFTADFVGSLAASARVKKIAPFHFSKRYVGHTESVLAEVASQFDGEVISVSQGEWKPRF